MKNNFLTLTIGKGEPDVESFRRLIARIRRRLFVRRLLESLSVGLLFAEIFGLLLAIAAMLLDRRIVAPPIFLGGALVAGFVGSLVSALGGKEKNAESARAIDQIGVEDDRFLTTLALLCKTAASDRPVVERLQIADTLERVPNVDPRKVVPLRWPASLLAPAFLFLILSVILFVLKPASTTALERTPNETVAAIIAELKAEIQEPLRMMVIENPENEEIKKLDLRVAQTLRTLEEKSDDPKKGLAILSEMEREIQETVEAFQIEATNRSFQDVAEALAPTELTRGAADALLANDYEKAARELENIDFDKISARERLNLAKRLENAAKTIRSRRQEQLAQLTQQLADELQNAHCASCKNTSCQFAGKCRAQKSNQAMAKKLHCQLARLGLCKSACAGACASCEQNGSPNGTIGRKDVSSNAPPGGASSSFSRTEAADNPLTGTTDTPTETRRELQQVTGRQSGDGASEVEIVRTGEAGDETVKTPYHEVFREYQPERETALFDEEIPPERRQVIRDYFESIRPRENRGEEDRP